MHSAAGVRTKPQDSLTVPVSCGEIEANCLRFPL